MEKPKGRSDDMLIIRGVNVFPSQIETVLLNQGYTSNYQIVVGRENNTDTFEVRVEMTPDMFTDNVGEIQNLQKKLQRWRLVMQTYPSYLDQMHQTLALAYLE